jgi:hypothetical protein
MGIFHLLFGKRDAAGVATLSGEQGPAPVAATPPRRRQSAERTDGRLGPEGDRESGRSVPPEAENLKRWRESGHAQAWVEKCQGRWNHSDWLALLEELSRSPFWPMEADAVGLVLEAEKRQWLRRN